MSSAKDMSVVKWEEYLYYDESSPSGLRWKVSKGRVKEGDVAGSISDRGYWRISKSVEGKLKVFKCHRIIYAIVKGTLSTTDKIDHIDGNRLNNKIDNLRLTDAPRNARNMKMNVNNRTGVTGVYEVQYFCAEWVDGKGQQHRKSFSILEHGRDEAFRLACMCRMNAILGLNEQGAGYTERHGKERA